MGNNGRWVCSDSSYYLWLLCTALCSYVNMAHRWVGWWALTFVPWCNWMGNNWPHCFLRLPVPLSHLGQRSIEVCPTSCIVSCINIFREKWFRLHCHVAVSGIERYQFQYSIPPSWNLVLAVMIPGTWYRPALLLFCHKSHCKFGCVWVWRCTVPPHTHSCTHCSFLPYTGCMWVYTV